MVSDTDRVLVRSKLFVPQRRRGLVSRPALIEALEEGRAGRLTLVSAPTGFGKTSALAEWAERSPARFAWVSLDADDDEPEAFWTAVVAAIDGAAPELAGPAAHRLAAPGASMADEVLPALANQLADVAEPLVLVLDDYQEIADPEIHAGVNWLVGRTPPAVHLTIAAHADPPLSLGRLRARGELHVVGPAQLRFDDGEAAALLNGTHGLGLPEDALAALQERIEGWVAGLNLAALSLREPGDRGAFVAQLPVEDRYLVEYLWEEVVLHQPAEVREFLIRTSVLERLSGPLCDAVAQRQGSAAVLAELERGNLFVTAVDPERRWLRYHHLFRHMLQRRLEDVAPAEVADLHRRASAWFADHGDVPGTIEHALQAGDAHVAASTLAREWLALYSGGHAATLVGWVDGLPAGTLEDYPELALARIGVARAMGRMDGLERFFGIVERAAGAAAEPRRRDLLAGAARQRSMLLLGQADVGAAVALARRAVALRADGSEEAASDEYFLGVCLFWTDSRPESEAILRRYLDVVPAGEQDVRRVFAMALLAVMAAARGELEEARRELARCEATSRARGLAEHPPMHQAHVADGIVRLKLGEAAEAEERFERGTTLARRGGDRIDAAHVLLWLGLCRLGQGDTRGASVALRAADEQLGGARVPALVGLRESLLLLGEPPEPAFGDPDAEEQRVLELLPSELGYAEIAARLGVEVDQVRARARGLREKLGATTRDETVAHARQRGLL